MRQLGQILEEDLVGHGLLECLALYQTLMFRPVLVEDTKCQDLMKSMMSKSFVMISTVPEI